MKTCIEIKDLAFPIKLEQSETGPQLFKVTYGKQIRHKLIYEEAAEEVGAGNSTMIKFWTIWMAAGTVYLSSY